MLPIALPHVQLEVWPQRAVYWREQGCLLVADLHLGKADTFRQFGVGVPQTVQHTDLARLHELLLQTQPQRCLVLGDLVHGRILSRDTASAWNAMVQHHATTRFELVLGNHDRALQPDSLRLHAVHAQVQLQGVLLSHEPWARNALLPEMLNIHGHHHAAVRVEGSRRKSPALVYQPPYLSMPAFSAFTAGAQPKGRCQGVWLFAPDGLQVVRLV